MEVQSKREKEKREERNPPDILLTPRVDQQNKVLTEKRKTSKYEHIAKWRKRKWVNRAIIDETNYRELKQYIIDENGYRALRWRK